jgi:hypothetical protein
VGETIQEWFLLAHHVRHQVLPSQFNGQQMSSSS